MVIPTVVPSSVCGYTSCFAEFSVCLYQVFCRVKCTVIPGVVPSVVYCYTRRCAEFSVRLYQALCRIPGVVPSSV